MRASSFRYALAAGVYILATTNAITNPATAGEIITVKITDLAFSPAKVTATPGDTIEWVNEDFIEHTATANDGSFDVPLAVGAYGRLKITQSGTFAYFCRVHPNMTGVIDVD